jgi:hypothetical protein
MKKIKGDGDMKPIELLAWAFVDSITCVDEIDEFKADTKSLLKQVVGEIEGNLKRYKNDEYKTDNMVILTKRWKKLKDKLGGE